jgi:hypothetical protein
MPGLANEEVHMIPRGARLHAAATADASASWQMAWIPPRHDAIFMSPIVLAGTFFFLVRFIRPDCCDG